MSIVKTPRSSTRSIAALTAGLVMLLLLAACSSGASPSAATSAAASMSMPAVASIVPSAVGSAAASEPGAARCEITADASPSAAVTIQGFSFGGAVTIGAGQAVQFTNSDGNDHTVTEGTGGSAVANACVNSVIAAGDSVIVTFTQPGDYDITCRFHSSMHTVVHVS